jgi:hypothetical protein
MRLRLHGILGLTGAAVLIAASATVATAQSTRPSSRPLVLIVHGRGQLGRDSAVVRRDAWHALQGSMHTIGSDVSLEEDDVRLIWYADLLDVHSSSEASPSCSRSSSDSASDSASAQESTPSALSVIAMMAGALVEALATESKNDDPELRGFAGDLRYLAESDTRCAAESRVEAALRQAHRDGRPVILISHSLGALVSWGELTRASAASDTTLPVIQQWITMGSPLGSPEIRQLVFGDEREALDLPKTVHSWMNVVSTDDFFSRRIARDSIGSATLADVVTESAHDDPHQMMGYLSDAATARLVVAAWHCAETGCRNSETVRRSNERMLSMTASERVCTEEMPFGGRMLSAQAMMLPHFSPRRAFR